MQTWPQIEKNLEAKKSKLLSVFAKATNMLVAMILAILICIPASIWGQNAGNNNVYMTNDENI